MGVIEVLKRQAKDEGRREGRREGSQSEKIALIKNLLQKDWLNHEQIAQVVNLPVEEVEKTSKGLKSNKNK